MPPKKPPAPQGKVLNLSSEELKALLFELWDKQGMTESLAVATEMLRKQKKNVVIRHSLYYAIRSKWFKQRSEASNGAAPEKTGIVGDVVTANPVEAVPPPLPEDPLDFTESHSMSAVRDAAHPSTGQEPVDDEVMFVQATSNPPPPADPIEQPQFMGRQPATNGPYSGQDKPPDIRPRWAALAKQFSELDDLSVRAGGLSNVREVLAFAGKYDTFEKAVMAFNAVIEFARQAAQNGVRTPRSTDRASEVVRLYDEAEKYTFASAPVIMSEYDFDDSRED